MSSEAEYYGDDVYYPTFQPARSRNSVITRKPVAGPSTRAHHVSPPSTIHEPDQDTITPAPPLPSTQAEFENTTTPGGSQPFMHYEDFSYFEPEPKGDHNAQEREADALSVGESQRPEQPRRKRRKGDQRFPWIAEVLWLLLSIACFIVIIIILWKYDEKPLKHCPKDITINTFVAFFLALCQAAFILPVIEGLSQLKWNWYARSQRPLSDFQVFEDATRGLDGSLRLLASTQGRILSKLAAVLLLTSLVTSPLTQAVINYPTRFVAGDNGIASAPRSEQYPDAKASASGDEFDARQKQAVQFGIYNPANEPLSVIQPTCSSGECRWNSFQSLGVCVEVNDVTDYLDISKLVDADSFGLNLPAKSQVRNASLSNGAYLLGGPNTYNLNISFPYGSTAGTNSSDPRDQTLSFIEQPDFLSAALADFFVIYTNATEGTVTAPFRAVEILMHFCVNTYSITVVEGVSETTQTASDTNITTAQEEDSSSSGGIGSDMVSIAGDNGQNFAVNSTYALLLGDYLKQTLSGTYSLRLGDQAVGRTSASDAVGAALYLGDLMKELTESDNDALRQQAIRNITENVATSLSNTIRELGTTEMGTILVTETYVCVQWVYLVCVAAQILMSTMFLAGVIIQTSVWKVKVVKSSALATMVALNADDKGRLERENLGQLTQPRTMAARLRSAKARFASQEDGSWSLNLGSGHEAVG